MDPLLTILAVFGLLICSAFFSGSETAVTAASRARMHRFETEGVSGARIVNRLIEERERLIGAILLGNNLVNILASILVGGLFAQMFAEGGVLYATIVMTALVLIFAEVLPKTVAITNTDRVALLVAPLLRILVFVLAPIVGFVQWIVRRTLLVLGLDVSNTESVLSAHEELRGAIDLHHQEGAVFREDRDRLGGVLDLHELEVGDVMVHRKSMSMIDADQPSSVVISQILKSPHTRIPIWQDDPENIIGVLHARDILRALSSADWDPDKLDMKAIASTAWFVPETTSLREQLDAFLAERGHLALVVDEYGALQGLVTLEDILEEIVGEISDEHDVHITGLRPQADGSIIVDGSVPVRDLNRAMDWTLSDEEATTIAGLVIHEAQTIPDVGQIFTFYGYKFEILRRQRNQIMALRITPPRSQLSVGEASKVGSQLH